MMNKLEISIHSEISNISSIEHFIDEFFVVFNLSFELYGRVSLSVIEAVNNAIIHGNERDCNKSVTLIAEKSDHLLKVTVIDQGKGFNYKNIPDPTSLDSVATLTGRGLYLMKTLSDQLIFENNGSEVSLIFIL